MLTCGARPGAGSWRWAVAVLAVLGLVAQAVQGPPDWLFRSVQALQSVVMHALSRPTEPGMTATLSGWPHIIDGDTIALAGHHVRLQGIDAPESTQECQDRYGLPWACGRQAAAALRSQIGWSRVRCDRLGSDPYGRVLARCYRGDTDLNRWMVRNGWAVAYRRYDTSYIAEEAAARQAGDGVWRGPFMMPWDWRRDHHPNGWRAQSR